MEIVSTGSVATKDERTTPWSVGTPQHIRDRFSRDEVRSLVRLAWWDWPIEVITENIRTIAGEIEDPTGRAPYRMVDEARGGLWDTSDVGAANWAIFFETHFLCRRAHERSP